MHRFKAEQICPEIVLHCDAKLSYYPFPHIFLLPILSALLAQHIFPNGSQTNEQGREEMGQEAEKEKKTDKKKA